MVAEGFKERRAIERIGAHTTLTLTIDRKSGRQFSATSKNISPRNICFHTDAPIEPDDRVALQLTTISGLISVTAVVVRRIGTEVGCQFVDVSKPVETQIRNWLFPPFEP